MYCCNCARKIGATGKWCQWCGTAVEKNAEKTEEVKVIIKHSATDKQREHLKKARELLKKKQQEKKAQKEAEAEPESEYEPEPEYTQPEDDFLF